MASGLIHFWPELSPRRWPTCTPWCDPFSTGDPVFSRDRASVTCPRCSRYLRSLERPHVDLDRFIPRPVVRESRPDARHRQMHDAEQRLLFGALLTEMVPVLDAILEWST